MLQNKAFLLDIHIPHTLFKTNYLDDLKIGIKSIRGV